MDQKIVDEAMRYLAPVDFILDMYDMGYYWASKKLLDDVGYTLSEFQQMHVDDLLKNTADKDKYREEIAEWLVKKHGTTTLIVSTKSGKKIRAEAEYHVFNFNGVYYLAGKGINVVSLP